MEMNMKLSLSVIILLIVASLASIGISCGTPATATPTGTVNAYLDALLAQDPQALVSYETEDHFGVTRDQRIAYFEHDFLLFESTSATNRSVVVESETDTTAIVRYTYDFHATYTSGETEDHPSISSAFTLRKVGDKWLIEAYHQ